MKKLRPALLYLLLFSFPFQLGKHFWLSESLVLGRRIDYLSPTIYATDILMLAFVASFLFTRHPSLSTLLKKIFISISILVLLLWFFHPLSWLSLYFGLRIILLTTFGVCAAALMLDRQMILKPLILGIGITGVLGLAQFLAQSALGSWWHWLGERFLTADTPGVAQLITTGGTYLRPYASFSHPNAWGGFLTVLLPYFLWCGSVKNKGEYLWRFSSLYFLLLGIFLSFSRMAWVTTLFLLTVFYVANQRLAKSKSGMIASALLLALTIEELLIGRFTSLFFADSQSIGERQKLMEAAGSFFARSPLVGVGLGRFIPAVTTLDPPLPVLQPVHSVFGLILAETGLAGLGVGLWILVTALKNTWQTDPATFWALGAVVLLGSVDHYFLTLPQPQLLLVLVLATAFTKHNQHL